MPQRYFITSESVTEGHPDKICDQISDAILDEIYKQDPKARVAVETLTTTGLIVVAGEVTTTAYADVQKIARETLREIGYTDPAYGIDCYDAGVLVSIHEQSPDIAIGVNETEELMPLPITLAHKLTERMAFVRKNEIVKHLGPDGKSQVTVEYLDDKPVRVDTIVIAQQHTNDAHEDHIREQIIEHVINLKSRQERRLHGALHRKKHCCSRAC